MASIQSYPSKVVAVSGLDSANADNCFDNSSSKVILVLSNSFVAGGFNFSNIPNEAVIKTLSFTIVGEVSSSSNYFAVRAVKNATSSSSYTDLGDGQITFIQNSTSKQTVTKSFPVAATALTVAQLKNNTLQARFYGSGSGYLYELYATVEYELPSSVITVHAGTGGTVTGGGEYENGTTATLTATPNAGYVFKQWSDGNTNATRTITVTANATYTAEFEKVYTSNLFVGTQRVTAYCGTQKMCAYCGTQKI
ncbi:MAG: hypothetical protein IJC45_07935 [Clostridia bacterium]|nr:hypothetical protein [Clostridia bacterium]